MEYKVVHVSAIRAEKMKEKMADVVNNEIKNGWKPQGGVACLGGSLIQAMVKE